jgi:hypothetical protein
MFHCLTMPLVSSRIMAPCQCFCGKVNATLRHVAKFDTSICDAYQMRGDPLQFPLSTTSERAR